MDAFERRADPKDGRAALCVAGIGADRDTMYVPGIERVCQQQILCFGVDRRALSSRCQPRAADLDLVGKGVATPPFQPQVPGAADEGTVAESSLREWHG